MKATFRARRFVFEKDLLEEARKLEVSVSGCIEPFARVF
jgi:post-segregation antitoxin (ccd killing protein)